ncbi:MAG: class I tRNA ligase family protein, partial [Armatimonadetes bacterium]|nr:class I tRNA ligase family protein [Armatimonadota bacterium]
VARMIMMGQHLVGEEPFSEVFLHGLVRDEHGQKMSKSQGNAVDPIELMDEYGADAMRFALCQLITHGQDVTYSPDRMVGARNFCNKLWNASRFVIMNLADMQPVELESARLSLSDRWILSRHSRMLAEVQRQLDGYNLAQAAEAIYDYVWGEFCDWYVEVAKIDLYGDDDARKATVQTILHELLSQILRTIHPFMPFITEEIWQRLPQSGGTISRQPYPQSQEQWPDEEAEEQMSLLQGVITQIRALRAELTINPGQPADVTVIAPNDETMSLIASQQQAISSLATVEELNLATAPVEPPPDALSAVSEGMQIYLHLPGTLNIEKEIERIQREIDELEELRRRSVGKLQNSDFLNKAPEEVVNTEREKLAEFDRDLQKLWDQIKLLSSVSR